MEYIFPILSEAVCPQYYCQYLVKRWVFNPLHVKSLGSPLLASAIAELSIFRFSKHPELAPKIEAMKGPPST